MSLNTMRQLTRAEKEVEAAAERLGMQTESALAAVAVAAQDYDELETRAGRLERAARDLAVALRELAQERRINKENY